MELDLARLVVSLELDHDRLARLHLRSDPHLAVEAQIPVVAVRSEGGPKREAVDRPAHRRPPAAEEGGDVERDDDVRTGLLLLCE
jgi:hypothetical protein